MNTLLIIPPLTSYYLALEWTQKRLPLIQRLLLVVAIALCWVFIQREMIYPAFYLTPEWGENLTNLLFSTTFGTCSWFAVQSIQYRRRLKQAEQYQTLAELRLLESQLAPHTLFNMTNIVYAAMLDDREKAIPLFLKMNEMLRHLVARTKEKWVPASEEIAFIEHYAALERARSPDKAEIDIVANGDLDAPIPPMIFATLFENAVKHGRFPDGRIQIKLNLEIDDDRIVFDISNHFPIRGESDTRGMGLGLESVSRRLFLLYPSNHQFKVDNDGKSFNARIEIF